MRLIKSQVVPGIICLIICQLAVSPSANGQPVRTARVRAPEGVELLEDVAYREGNPAWKLDLAKPAVQSHEKRPAIVFIHGGGWRSGDKRQGYFLQGALDFAQQGYVCVSVNYRLTDEAPFPACLQDVKCAVRWLRAHASEHGIDPERIGAYGNSAGAHLAAMLGLAKDTPELIGDAPFANQSGMVQAVCCSATPTDFTHWSDRGSRGGRRLLAGPEESFEERQREASPIFHVTAEAPPFLMFHGTDDRTVPFGQSERLVAAFQEAGAKDMTLKVYDGAGHGVFNEHAPETHDLMRDFFSRTLRHSTTSTGAIAKGPQQPDRASERRTSGPNRRTFTFDRMLRMDADKDGKIAKSEFRGGTRMFEQFDADSDGFVERKEFESRMKNRGPAAGNRAGGKAGMEQRVQSQGIQVGDLLPDQTVLDLEGHPVQLATLWKDKPVVLVTASITCPIAVDSCPTIDRLRNPQHAGVDFAILYVREAHPEEQDQRRSTSKPGQPPAGFGSHPQPQTQAERNQLATLFAEHFSGEVPVYVSKLDNRLIEQLGTGPNSGLLISKEGKLLVKQGWYDTDQMRDELQNLPSAKP